MWAVWDASRRETLAHATTTAAAATAAMTTALGFIWFGTPRAAHGQCGTHARSRALGLDDKRDKRLFWLLGIVARVYSLLERTGCPCALLKLRRA